MGRPCAHGLEWFKIDVNPAVDDALESVVSICGGMAFYYYYLIKRAILSKGYYTPWKELDRANIYRRGANYFSDRILSRKEFDEIISRFVEYDLFHREMFEKNVLTSSEIQKEWFEGVKRRTEIVANKQYVLVDKEWINRHVPCGYDGIVWVTNGKL